MSKISLSAELSPLEREIASGKPVMVFTIGDSMEPLLYNKSTRVVVVRNDTDLKPCDLPVYKRPDGQFVMHRIIRASHDCYYTRGDNRCGLECVPKEWVLGVVTEIYREGEHFSVTERRYRYCVRAWNAIYPFRWLFYKIRARRRRKWRKNRK